MRRALLTLLVALVGLALMRLAATALGVATWFALYMTWLETARRGRPLIRERSLWVGIVLAHAALGIDLIHHAITWTPCPP